jgi:uncharacterized protein
VTTSVTRVQRPVWRRFSEQNLVRAAAYAKTGGGALVAGEDGSIRMLFELTNNEIPELFFWAILDLEKRKWSRIKEGPAAGLGTSIIPRRKHWVAERWMERDGGRPGPKASIVLDCLACGACCCDSKVLLVPDDLVRWRRAGRPELARAPHTKRIGDSIVMPMSAAGPCKHLQSDKKCDIYALRPFNCSAFPAGSEPCLGTREDTFGIVD